MLPETNITLYAKYASIKFFFGKQCYQQLEIKRGTVWLIKKREDVIEHLKRAIFNTILISSAGKSCPKEEIKQLQK